MTDKDMGLRIYEVLQKTIPDMEGIEVIYTNHYIQGAGDDGYDEVNHLLLIRDGMYCYEGCKREFDLDIFKISQALEKELPINATFDRSLRIENGQTYRFYIEIKK